MCNSSSGAQFAANAPRAAPTAMNAVIGQRYSRRSWPSLALAMVAQEALTTMIAVEVAIAVCIASAPLVASTAAYTAGTVTNPPPNPNTTVVMPVTQPTTTSSKMKPIMQVTVSFPGVGAQSLFRQ